MMRKTAGLFLVLIGGIIVWLFPALVTPRERQPYDGQDLRSYCASEVGKQKRYHLLTMRVCMPAAFVMGVGVTLFLRRKRKTINSGVPH